MNPEHMALAGAVAVFALCALYSFWPRGRGILPTGASKAAIHPMRAAFDAIEDQARNLAAERVAADVGEHYANQHKAAIQAAIGPKAANPPNP